MLLTGRRDGTMAALLSTIVIMFLACHSTKIIVNFYEAIQVRAAESSSANSFGQIVFHPIVPLSFISHYVEDGPARRASAPNLGDVAR